MPNIVDIFIDLSRQQDADVFVFNAKIDDNNADQLINKIRAVKKRKKNLILLLTTNGGDPDAGYRIVRIIKQYYNKGNFYLYVFGFCKSTGTLIALGADEIVMGDLAEFGPLDTQLANGDELINTSGMSYLQGLIALTEKLNSSFDENFMNLKSGYGITTRTAAEIGSKLAIGVIEPIVAQIDPLRLGEVQRSLKVAQAYGERILGEKHDTMESVKKLMGNYPSHTFVIDFGEMQSLFPKKVIRRPTELENMIEDELYGIVRKPGKDKYIVFFDTDDEIITRENQLNEQEQKPVGDSESAAE